MTETTKTPVEYGITYRLRVPSTGAIGSHLQQKTFASEAERDEFARLSTISTVSKWQKSEPTAEDFPLDENAEYEVEPFADGGQVCLTLGELIDLATAHGVDRGTVITLASPDGDYRNVAAVGVPTEDDPDSTWLSLTLTSGDYFDSRFVP